MKEEENCPFCENKVEFLQKTWICRNCHFSMASFSNEKWNVWTWGWSSEERKKDLPADRVLWEQTNLNSKEECFRFLKLRVFQ